MAVSSSLTNNATLSIDTTGTLNNYGTTANDGTLSNSGTLTITGSSGDFINDGWIGNTGRITIASGAVLNNNTIITYTGVGNYSTGNITVASGGTFNNSDGGAISVGAVNVSGTMTLKSGSIYEDFGATTVNSGGSLTVDSTSGLLEVDGTLTVNNGGSFVNNGYTQITSTMVVGGYVENDNQMYLYDTTVNSTGGIVSKNASYMENDDVMTLNGTLTIEDGSEFVDWGVVDVNKGSSPCLVIDSTSTYYEDGTMNVNGYVVNSGQIQNSGGIIISQNQLLNESTGYVYNSGYLEVDAAFNNYGCLENDGTMQIGNGTVAGSMNGAIVNNAILQYLDGYSSSYRPTFTNVISGSGGTIKNLGVDVIALPDTSGQTLESGIRA